MHNHLSFLVKPSSSLCNLDCTYCFYKKHTAEELPNPTLMTLKCAYKLVDRVMSSTLQSAHFIFQGGEPLLQDIDFYSQFVSYVNEHNTGKKVEYSLQTNATLITHEFALFFKKNNFLIGVSLDGIESLHNLNRDASFVDVMKGINILKENDVEFNILSVVTIDSMEFIEESYKFFIENGFTYLQFIPDITSLPSKPGAVYYGEFLIKLFDLWYKDVINHKQISIRLFEDFILNAFRIGGVTCGMNGYCALNLVVEHNGDVYPCDFYVSDSQKIGNINDDSIEDIINSQKAKEFLNEGTLLSNQCNSCSYLAICKGGCKAYKTNNNHFDYCHSYIHLFEERKTEFNNLFTYLKNKIRHLEY